MLRLPYRRSHSYTVTFVGADSRSSPKHSRERTDANGEGRNPSGPPLTYRLEERSVLQAALGTYLPSSADKVCSDAFVSS